MNAADTALSPTVLEAGGTTADDLWLEQAPLVEEARASGTLKLVFLIGMARSGTTWLRGLLNQHPAVVNIGETHLFSQYLSGVPGTRNRLAGTGIGLARLLTPEGERRAWRALALRALLGGRPDWPNRRALIEKTPAHTYSAQFIRELLPEAHFVHLVRDPRAVVASWKAAGRTWAHDWARHGSIHLAVQWTHDLRSGRQLAEDTDRYRRVHYEELSSDGEATLHGLLHWLGLEATAEECAGYFEACRLENMRTWGWPEGFFRRGLVDGWRDDLSRREVARVERVTGPLMEELGYARSRRRRGPLPSLWLYRAAGRLERASAHLAERLRL